MATLVWDEIGERTFETGVDRGVLYQFNNKGVVWNGLTSISEQFSQSAEPVYYDGVKINDVVTLSDFAATLTAITYPEEFQEYVGYGKIRQGLSISDQPLRRFGLSYRTSVGNDLEQQAGYKIHILYNLTAIPSEIAYSSISDSPEFTEFSWDITAVLTPLIGYRPTAHLILDSRFLPSELITAVELILYGSDVLDPRLPGQQELIDLVFQFYVMHITDNGDGTWTATTNTGYDTLISVDVDDVFTLTNVNAIYVNSTTYELSDTLDEIP